ncbi:DUF4272 domain-containing protein [Aureivirga sp. CE67]|uniref:DUF4272 domain-containing protein n=1 Tax=Aureivirga sp. CE67 TaxID=1788983 RepID=UPI0018CAA723|nr:DUF4272 domain-containing protein [Aureivirga sp. CE67]
MSFLKKLFGSKATKEKSQESTKTVTLEEVLASNEKPEILFRSKVTVAIGGDKSDNDNNAFITMGLRDENLKSQVLEHYVWQSFGEDIDENFKCTMQLVRIDVQDQFKPEVSAEVVAEKLFKAIGEMDSEEEEEMEEHPDLEKFKKVPWMTDMRLQNVSICLHNGFRPSNALPTEFERELRPAVEIAKRLNAIKALILWLMIPEEQLESAKILNFVEKNGLRDFMDEGEKAILNNSRTDEDARNAIGWKFENAWPLAWYFGYKKPSITGEMMPGEQMQEILMDFTCPLDADINEWIKEYEILPEEDLMQMTDLFYCLHNAVRSAQMGRQTVPNGFDPMGNGGVIHERRHSLTWMVSKGTNWEDTDLST